MFEHPSFVQLRQPSVHTTQLSSGATKIDFSAGFVDLVSGFGRSDASTNPTIKLDSIKPVALRPSTLFVISAFDVSCTSFYHLVGAGEPCRRDPETYALARWSPHT
jgi:hypothetical protein